MFFNTRKTLSDGVRGEVALATQRKLTYTDAFGDKLDSISLRS